MGSVIEFNDSLQLTTEQGFPADLQLARHLKKPFTAEQFSDRVFEFQKPNMRLFHPAPTRVFLVHNINGTWLYWGHCHILEQTIHAKTKMTTGKFVITEIYDPVHQRAMTERETRPGENYFASTTT